MKTIVQQANRDSGKYVLLTAIKFEDLKDKTELTYKIGDDVDPYLSNVGEGKREYYQRSIDQERVRSIADYIRKSLISPQGSSKVEKPLFPNSMIIAIKEPFELNVNDDVIFDLDWQIVDKVYIVDGQHRFVGMRHLYEDLTSRSSWQSGEDTFILKFIQNYRFNCTVLVNYDLWEQAEVFADINFKQKKVNKSLYYEIYGQYPPENSKDYERSYIFLAHNLVNVLNYNNQSSLKGMIKMLGTGSGTISQAYLVESIARHIQPDKSIWHYNPFNDDFSEKSYMHMGVELLSYFAVVKELFPKYLGNPNSILSKTTGLGAMIRLVKDVHDRLPDSTRVHLKEYDNLAVDSDYCRFTKEYLSPLVKHGGRLFGKDSQYAGGGGAGNVGKLYRDMKDILSHENDVSLF